MGNIQEPEGPDVPNQNEPPKTNIGLGTLTVPYPWAPEGLATPVLFFYFVWHNVGCSKDDLTVLLPLTGRQVLLVVGVFSVPRIICLPSLVFIIEWRVLD